MQWVRLFSIDQKFSSNSYNYGAQERKKRFQRDNCNYIIFLEGNRKKHVQAKHKENSLNVPDKILLILKLFTYQDR